MLEVMQSIHGSHLYGLDTPASDKDYKGVFLPTSRKDLFLGRAKKHISSSTGDDRSKNGATDTDLESFSLHTFFEMCHKGEMIAIDMLHTPLELCTFPSRNAEIIWREIYIERSAFYSSSMVAYLGYIKKQTAKYGLKGSRMGVLEEVLTELAPYSTERLGDLEGDLPVGEFTRWYTRDLEQGRVTFYEVLGKSYQSTVKVQEVKDSLQKVYNQYGERTRLAKDNLGVDWKAVSHALRAAFQLREIYLTGDLVFPLENRDLILDVKLGKLDLLTEVAPILERLTTEVVALSKASDYPETLSKVWWEDYLVDLYELYSK